MNRAKKKLISIIIPIYNSYHLIDNCLKSLENQTSNNFEVIFVDDCSSDDSYEKLSKRLKECSFKYKIVQNETNSGPGATRNNGIKISSGNYITFLDSDDYIANNFIEEIDKVISDNNADLLIFDYFMVNNQSEKSCSTFPNDIKEGILNVFDTLALSNGMCWGKIFKKSIITKNKITFPNLMRSEDLAFVKIFISKCKKIRYVKKEMYYYIQNPTSIMHNASTLNIQNNIETFNYIKNNIRDCDAVEMIFIREYLYLIVQIMILKKYKTVDIKKFINEYNRNYPLWWKNKYIKCQKKYMRILLKLIKFKLILPLRIVFKLK